MASNLAVAFACAGLPADFLAHLYPAVLGRSADEAGYADWLARMEQGTSPTATAAAFLDSLEYRAAHPAWLDGMYMDVLGRPGDASGLAYWQQALIAGASAQDVAVAFLSSPEFLGQVGSPVGGADPGLDVVVAPCDGAALTAAQADAQAAGLPWLATGFLGRYHVAGDPAALDQFKSSLASVTGAAISEPPVAVELALTPNDPALLNGSLWGLGGTYGINALTAWDSATAVLGVTVGITDTGIDLDHPDLYKNIWINQGEIPAQWYSRSSASSSTYDRTVLRSQVKDADGDGRTTFWDLNDPANAGLTWDNNGDGRITAADLLRPLNQGGWEDGTDADGNARRDDLFGWNFLTNTNRPYDDNGHGTHVAGTIGAMGNNSLGVVGVAWKVQLMALKFLDASGSGFDGGAAGGIGYAAAKGARVINASWGGGYSSTIYSALSASSLANTLFVAAAGNNGANSDTAPFYPAAYTLPNIVSVQATNGDGTRAGFSNYGLTSVDIGAPGNGILSTIPGAGYSTKSGTSMAAPHVSGAAALVLGQVPSLSMAQLKNRLLTRARTVPALAGTSVTGGLIDLAAAILPAEARIIDNGDGGFSTVGSWTQNTSEGYQGDMHHIITPGGNGSRTASWTFSGLTPGVYRVSATWTAASNRATNSPFTVLDGNTALTTVRLNQQAAPLGFTAGGVAWQPLGTFTLQGSQLVARLSDDVGSGYVIADAVRVEKVVMDDSDPSFATSSGWTRNASEGYKGAMRHNSVPGGAGGSTATWTFDGLASGGYQVFVTWTAYSNRATNSPFTVLDGSTALTTMRLNQQAAPASGTAYGVAWQVLGGFTIQSGQLVVRLSDDANGYVIADAVRVERSDAPATPPAPAPSVIIVIDNSDPAGFTTTGAWTLSTLGGYNGSRSYPSGGPGTGGSTATWTFSNLAAGQYRVAVTYPAQSNRATNSPFTVSVGSTQVLSAAVNQQVAPSDFTDRGFGWKNLGIFTVASSGSQVAVRLSDKVSSGFVIADAVRLERIS